MSLTLTASSPSSLTMAFSFSSCQCPLLSAPCPWRMLLLPHCGAAQHDVIWSSNLSPKRKHQLTLAAKREGMWCSHKARQSNQIRHLWLGIIQDDEEQLPSATVPQGLYVVCHKHHHHHQHHDFAAAWFIPVFNLLRTFPRINYDHNHCHYLNQYRKARSWHKMYAILKIFPTFSHILMIVYSNHWQGRRVGANTSASPYPYTPHLHHHHVCSWSSNAARFRGISACDGYRSKCCSSNSRRA